MTTLPETQTAPAGTASQDGPNLGLVMGGGGARAAYQVGFLCYLARQYPDLKVPIVTGVSSGGINAAHLASHHGSFGQAVRELVSLWQRLTVEEVFRVDAPSLTWIGVRWLFQLLSGGVGGAARVRGLVDTTPLRNYLSEVLHAVDGELTGIQYNLALGRLKAVALSTSSYTTGQSLTWIQGQDLHESAHLEARDFYRETRYYTAERDVPAARWQAGTGTGWSSPFRLSGTPAEFGRYSNVGEDNDYVFGEMLAMPPDQIQKLTDDGVLY